MYINIHYGGRGCEHLIYVYIYIYIIIYIYIYIRGGGGVANRLIHVYVRRVKGWRKGLRTPNICSMLYVSMFVCVYVFIYTYTRMYTYIHMRRGKGGGQGLRTRVYI
jgi:hypothetical protein